MESADRRSQEKDDASEGAEVLPFVTKILLYFANIILGRDRVVAVAALRK